MTENKIVAVVFADAHLTNKTWQKHNIRGDTFYAFYQVIDEAIRLKVPIIAAGDLIDKKTNVSETIVCMNDALQTLHKAGLTFYYVQGQHELSSVPWMNVNSCTRRLHRELVNLGGLNIYGIDYQSTEGLAVELKDIPKNADVLVCHQVWSEFMGDITFPQGSFADIPHVSTVITGDYHENVLDKTSYSGANGQPLTIFSPGATTQRKINEPDKHYYGQLYSDGRLVVKKLKSRLFCAYNLNTQEEIDRFISGIPTQLDYAADYAVNHEIPGAIINPLWHVTYSARFGDLPGRINKVLSESKHDIVPHLFWKSIPVVKEEKEAKRRKVSKAYTLETALKDVLTTESPEYSLAVELLTSEQPAVDVETWLLNQLESN